MCITNTEAKADQGKARLSLVPLKILYDIAYIREYGCKKYHDPDNWKKVEPWRYRDAMMRHMCAYIEDPDGVDDESGLPHLWHLACNVAFLCALEPEKNSNKNTDMSKAMTDLENIHNNSLTSGSSSTNGCSL